MIKVNNNILAIIGLSAIVSCKNNFSKEDLKQINGFWEINKVITKEGKTVDYEPNTTIDYFQLNDNKGFRQKVSPTLYGKFQSNSVKEDFQIVDSVGKFFIKYKTPFAQWKEEVINIENNKLEIENEIGNVYIYTRYEPISLEKQPAE